MKTLKISGIVIASVIILLYSAFLFILPNVVKVDNYKADIQKAVEDSVKLKFDYSSAKLYTHPLLKAGLKVTSPSLTYLDDEKLFNAKELDVRIDIIPLLFKKVKISKFTLSTPEIFVDILEDNKYRFESLLVNNEEVEEQKEEETKQAKENADFDFVILLANAVIDNYSVLVSDLKTGDNLKLFGDYIKVFDFDSSKRVNVGADGKVTLNDAEDIKFSVAVNYEIPKAESTAVAPVQEQSETPELINIVQMFKSYEPKSEIDADLKISGQGDKTHVNGSLNVDKFSIKLGAKRLPDSFMKLGFEKQNVDINTELFVADNEKLDVNGSVNYGKNTNIDLACKAEKIYLKSILELAKGVLDSIMMENDLDQFNVQGYISSDFKVNTNLKELTSEGNLKLAEGNISHNASALKISDLKSTVNFANNSIKIEDTSANVNDTKINVEGTVDADSKLDIKLFTDKLQVDKLFNAFAPVDLKKVYHINSGFLTVNADIKGKLEEIVPKANILLENLSLTDSVNNFTLTNKQIKSEITAQNNDFNGIIDLTSMNVKLPDLNLTLQNPSMQLAFNNKDIELKPADIYLDKSVFVTAGQVKNYMTKPDYKFVMKGSVDSNFIAGFVPKDLLNAVSYKGKMPVTAQINGDASKTYILAQLLANSSNYFAPITVNKLVNKSSIVNLDMTLANNVLNISDVSLYELPSTPSALNDTLSTNIANAYRILQVAGSVKNLDKKVQTLDNVKVNFPASISLSTPMFKDSKLMLKGSVNVAGNTSKPVVTGNIYVSDVALPEFSTTVGALDANLTESNINLKVSNLALENSKFNCELNTPQNFGSVIDITSFNLTSPNIDADRLAVISEQIMKATEGSGSTSSSASSSNNSKNASADIPVKISKGSVKIDKLTSGELVFTNINSPMTLINNTVNLNGLTLNAYDGTMSGDVSYNMISSLIKAKVKGNGIDANKFIGAAALLKDQIFGTLKFDTNVSLSGATYQEQMKTLTGTADFTVENGKLGSLGSIETFLGANNLVSQSLISTKLGSAVNAVAPYNSSEFKNMTGKVSLKGGVATINEIKSAGDNMSLYITGDMNLLNNTIKATLLGRLSQQLANALGPVANVSTDKLISSIPGVGSYALGLFKALTVTADEALLKKIPDLTKNSENSRNFKVVLNGNVEKPASVVKLFQWIETESEYSKTQSDIKSLLGGTSVTTDTTKIKEQAKEQAKDFVKSLLKPETEETTSESEEISPQAKRKQNIQKGVSTLFNMLNEAGSTSKETSASEGTNE